MAQQADLESKQNKQLAENFLKVSRDDIAESSLSGLQTYNLNEITKHKSRDDLWIVINERVYDITNLLGKHPGGEKIVLDQIKINQNLTAVFYKMMHTVDALSLLKGHCIGTVDKEVIGWGDLFVVKVSILDKQHENLISILNSIYNNGIIEDLHKFIIAFEIHCDTELYFMNTYKFENDIKTAHINDHERMKKIITDVYNELSKKYKNKINLKKNKNGIIESKNNKNEIDNISEPFKCQELTDFCVNKMGSLFKTHAFQFDALYIDELPDVDPSSSFKTETDELFGLIRPIFPKNDGSND